MAQSSPAYRKPNFGERIFNRLFGMMVGMGLGLSHHHLLVVRGRKSGHMHSTPIDLLQFRGKQYLVAPRGETEWVRNAVAAGEIILRRGSKRQRYQLRALADGEKPEVLKAYLDRFRIEVQRYFPVRAGSPPQEFAEVAWRYPAFELIPVGESIPAT